MERVCTGAFGKKMFDQLIVLQVILIAIHERT